MNIRDAATHGTSSTFAHPWASDPPDRSALALRERLAHLAETGR